MYTEMKAESNQPVTGGVFRQKQAELTALIDSKFGKVHPASKYPRLDPATQK
jgi:hypothetical protein